MSGSDRKIALAYLESMQAERYLQLYGKNYKEYLEYRREKVLSEKMGKSQKERAIKGVNLSLIHI